MINTNDFNISGALLNKYLGDEKDVVVPKGIIAVERKAFAECRKIKSVTIPASVKYIRDSAFENCKALTDIKLHDGELIIEDHAFKGCNKLTGIRGLGVTCVGDIFAIMKTYFSRKHIKLLETAMELQRADLAGMMQEMWNFTLGEYNALIDKATENGNPAITAALIDARNKAYTSEEVENAEKIALEKALGIRELTFEDYKEIFILSRGIYGPRCKTIVRIKRCKRRQPHVEIPGTIEGMPVHLDVCAFSGDEILEEIILHEGVEVIGREALYHCPNLRSVQIPSTVTAIERGAFGGVNKLEISVAKKNAFYTSREGVLYDKNCTTLLCCPAGKQGTLMLPDGLTEITGYVFTYCRDLKKIVIPGTVKRISADAFSLAAKPVWNGSEEVLLWPFVIQAPAGSYAETYAKENNIPFVAE